MKVGDVMTRDVLALNPDDTLRAAFNIVQRNRIRHIPIVEGRTLIGIVTDRDMKRATPSVHSGASQEDFDQALDEITLSRVMTRDPQSLRPEMPLKEAVQLLVDRKYGAMPVVENGELVGILSDIDLLRILQSML